VLHITFCVNHIRSCGASDSERTSSTEHRGSVPRDAGLAPLYESSVHYMRRGSPGAGCLWCRLNSANRWQARAARLHLHTRPAHLPMHGLRSPIPTPHDSPMTVRHVVPRATYSPAPSLQPQPEPYPSPTASQRRVRSGGCAAAGARCQLPRRPLGGAAWPRGPASRLPSRRPDCHPGVQIAISASGLPSQRPVAISASRLPSRRHLGSTGPLRVRGLRQVPSEAHRGRCSRRARRSHHLH